LHASLSLVVGRSAPPPSAFRASLHPVTLGTTALAPVLASGCSAGARPTAETSTGLPRIFDHGGSSHFAVSPHGELAVRVAPGSASGDKCDDGVDLVPGA
jgi:hypothetical protein